MKGGQHDMPKGDYMNNALLVNELINNGGFTTYKGRLVNLKKGYMVAVAQYEQKMSLDQFKQFNLYGTYELAVLLDMHVGGWLDNGIVYIDNSIHVYDINEALELARHHEQLAIYDLENDTSIYL